MKNAPISNLSVKRISSSPYFSSTFTQLESETIGRLTNAEMLPFNSSKLASVLITNTHTELSSISTDQLAACRLMIHPNSGYDNFSREFIANAKFPIVIGNPIRANAVANFILSALFSHYEVIPTEIAWNPSRKWPRKILSELNILILGHGHIGSLLKNSLTPLAQEVRIYDPYAGFTNLDLNNIDVLIPTCSLNKKNTHFIDKNFLLKLNEDFLLINAARGSLIHTQNLLDVLKNRPEAYAVLDVFEKEPCNFENIYNEAKNISLTSHIAGVYKNIDAATAHFEASVIFDFINLENSLFENKYKNLLLKNRLFHQDLI